MWLRPRPTHHWLRQCRVYMLDDSQTSMFCGQHVVLAPNGNSAKQTVEYDFRQENPVERYLQSILQLDNC